MEKTFDAVIAFVVEYLMACVVLIKGNHEVFTIRHLFNLFILCVVRQVNQVCLAFEYHIQFFDSLQVVTVAWS